MDGYVNDVNSSLKLEWVDLPDVGRLLCDLSTGRPRPLVPAALVKRLMSSVHSLVHQGGNALLRDLRRRYVWRNMASDAKAFCRSCPHCQRSKVTRHTKTPLLPLDMPDARFAAVHLDLVGPLPESAGYSYLLTLSLIHI